MKTTLLIGLLLAVTYTIQAQGGQLDTGFGEQGVVNLGPGPMHDNINDIGIQSDGKIIGFGMTMGAGNFNFDLAITRLLEDGSLDTNFGNQGYFTYDHAGESDFIYAGLVLPDGKILACGAVSNTAVDTDVLVIRLNEDGSLDTTFGDGDGMAIAAVDTGEDYANTLLVNQNGQIIIAGTTAVPGMTTTRGLVMAFTMDGQLDTTFGFNGIVVHNISNEYDSFQSIIELEEGGYLTAGYTSQDFSYHAWFSKLLPTGYTDNSFATNGQYIYTVGSSTLSEMIRVGDQFIACGNRYFGTDDALMISLDIDGNPTTGFGDNGIALHNFGETNTANDVLFDSEGGLTLTGSTGASFFGRDLLIFRTDLTGILQTTFGTDGYYTQSFANNFDVAMSLVEHTDSKILVGGLAAENDNNMLFVRFNGAGTASLGETPNPTALTMFPQPSHQHLNVQSPLMIREIEWYNANGQALRVEKIAQTRVQLSTVELPAGLYMLRVVLENGMVEHQKVVVAH